MGSLEIPYMRNGRGKLNMPHSLTAYIGFRYFDAASVTYFSFIADFLEFSAVALPVLCGTKYFLAKQPIAFRLQRPVVDGLRFFYFAM